MPTEPSNGGHWELLPTASTETVNHERGSYSAYLQDLNRTFWADRAMRFAGQDSLFDRPALENGEQPNRPPVFRTEAAGWNVLVDDTSAGARAAIEGLIPLTKRHRWFGSARSSQALAQSVFGNLALMGKLHVLEDLTTPDGSAPIFPPVTMCDLEWPVGPFLSGPDGRLCNHLGEEQGRSTSVDLLLRVTGYQVAIECKLAEAGIGTCSKVAGAEDSCTLVAKGLRYWDLARELFKWEEDIPRCGGCQLKDTYQLVRNVLTACLMESGQVDPARGHAVLVYDERNPTFQAGGTGMAAWEATCSALRYPHLLHRCSWQQITRCLTGDSSLQWLVQGLRSKYGIVPK